jgi:hypothetical protein
LELIEGYELHSKTITKPHLRAILRKFIKCGYPIEVNHNNEIFQDFLVKYKIETNSENLTFNLSLYFILHKVTFTISNNALEVWSEVRSGNPYRLIWYRNFLQFKMVR